MHGATVKEHNIMSISRIVIQSLSATKIIASISPCEQISEKIEKVIKVIGYFEYERFHFRKRRFCVQLLHWREVCSYGKQRKNTEFYIWSLGKRWSIGGERGNDVREWGLQNNMLSMFVINWQWYDVTNIWDTYHLNTSDRKKSQFFFQELPRLRNDNIKGTK